MWSGSIAEIPDGWALCDGTNGTPDLRDRFIVGAGNSYSIGDTGGENFHTLTVDEMPSHSHEVNDPGHFHSGDTYRRDTQGVTSGSEGVADNKWGSENVDIAYTGITIGNTGGDQSHENRPPYYALAFIMKLP